MIQTTRWQLLLLMLQGFLGFMLRPEVSRTVGLWMLVIMGLICVAAFIASTKRDLANCPLDPSYNRTKAD